MRILFVVPYIPSLVRVRPYNLIRALAAQGHRLHLALLQPPEDRAASVEPLRAFFEAIEVFPLSRAQTLMNAALALPSGLPLQAAYSHLPEAERRVQALAQSGQFEVLHVEHLRGAVLADGVKGLPCVFDSVDSITYLFEQARQHAPHWRQRLMAGLDLTRTRSYEAKIPGRFAQTLVTSPVDKQAFEKLAGVEMARRITVLPNGVDLNYFQPSPEPRDPATILFSGKLSYHANVAAALFLANEIMPLVWAKHSEAKLILAGKDPASSIRALAVDSRITVTGTVPDLRPLFARATLAAAPLRYGAGVQNKVLEAMACGLPVVATPPVLGALQAEPGRTLLVGENATALAEQIISLIEQPELCQRLGQAGRAYVEANHSWVGIARQLAEVYGRVV
jgi:polysaccharide biosynthesis protein PslH